MQTEWTPIEGLTVQDGKVACRAKHPSVKGRPVLVIGALSVDATKIVPAIGEPIDIDIFSSYTEMPEDWR